MRTLKAERGFTLIEILVVMVIVGVLATICIPLAANAVEQARVNTDIERGRQIKEAIDVFYVKNGKGPDTISELMNSGYVNRIVSAQTFNGSSDVIDSSVATANFTGNIFVIDLSGGTVEVKNVRSTPSEVVYDSGRTY